MTALDDLISAVEAGNDDGVAAYYSSRIFPVGYAHVINAYKGSLDAAKALHEALLPEWIACPQIGGKGAGVKVWHCNVEDWDTGDEIHADNMPCPARAWLLAILRAYRHGKQE